MFELYECFHGYLLWVLPNFQKRFLFPLQNNRSYAFWRMRQKARCLYLRGKQQNIQNGSSCN